MSVSSLQVTTRDLVCWASLRAVLKVIVVHRLNKLIFKLKQEDQHVISLLLFIYTQFLKCINSVTVSQCLYISNHKPFKSGKNHCKNQHIFKKKKNAESCISSRRGTNTTAYYKPCLQASSCFYSVS